MGHARGTSAPGTGHAAPSACGTLARGTFGTRHLGTRHLRHPAPYTSFVPFAPEYVTYVLNENFNDAKELFAGTLMAIHYAHLAEGRGRRPERPLSALIADVSRELVGTPITYTEEALVEILGPRHFVAVSATTGGPAPQGTARACRASRAELDADAAWWNGATDALKSAERRLAARSAAL